MYETFVPSLFEKGGRGGNKQVHYDELYSVGSDKADSDCQWRRLRQAELKLKRLLYHLFEMKWQRVSEIRLCAKSKFRYRLIILTTHPTSSIVYCRQPENLERRAHRPATQWPPCNH